MVKEAKEGGEEATNIKKECLVVHFMYLLISWLLEKLFPLFIYFLSYFIFINRVNSSLY